MLSAPLADAVQEIFVDVSGTVLGPDSRSTSNFGLVARYDTATDNTYFARIANRDGLVVAEIVKRIGGQKTVLSGFDTGLPSSGTVRFEVIGSSLKLFFNDQRMTLARWPNKGWTTIASKIASCETRVNWAFALKAAKRTSLKLRNSRYRHRRFDSRRRRPQNAHACASCRVEQLDPRIFTPSINRRLLGAIFYSKTCKTVSGGEQTADRKSLSSSTHLSFDFAQM